MFSVRELPARQSVGHIVVFKDSVQDCIGTALQVSRRQRIPVHAVFQQSLKGFATEIPEHALARVLSQHSSVVESIEEDLEVFAVSQQQAHPNPPY
jgi:hypothetical protein